MTKSEIIAELAKDQVVEKLISKITKNSSINMQDLAQDIYLNLLEKDEDYIVRLYEKKEINNFIAGMVNNNYFSKTSRYYKNYRKYEDNKESLSNIEGGEERYSNDD